MIITGKQLKTYIRNNSVDKHSKISDISEFNNIFAFKDTDEIIIDDTIFEITKRKHTSSQIYTGITDKNGVKIFVGNRVQPYRVNTFGHIPDTKLGNDFIVKHDNYVYGKWIAEDVGKDTYSVTGYHFGRELAVVGLNRGNNHA